MAIFTVGKEYTLRSGQDTHVARFRESFLYRSCGLYPNLIHSMAIY